MRQWRRVVAAPLVRRPLCAVGRIRHARAQGEQRDQCRRRQRWRRAVIGRLRGALLAVLLTQTRVLVVEHGTGSHHRRAGHRARSGLIHRAGVGRRRDLREQDGDRQPDREPASDEALKTNLQRITRARPAAWQAGRDDPSIPIDSVWCTHILTLH